jgi:peptidoglycan hydrolase-like protein with peptidoglycan-binding domain
MPPRRTTKPRDDEERAGMLGRAASWIVSHPREFVGALLASGAGVAILVNALFLQPGPHPAPIFRMQPVPLASDTTNATAPAVPRPRPEPRQEAKVEHDPVVPRTRGEITADIQRELARRGFYDGTVDGIYGAKTDAAMRDFEQHSGLKLGAEPAEVALRTLLQAPPSKPKPKTSAGPALAAAPAAPAGSVTAAPVGALGTPPVPPKPIPVATTGKRSDPLADLIAPAPKRVQAVQRALSDFGYGPLTPNGVFGPETERAIEKFERARKIPVTGHISERLMRELAAVTGRPLAD